MRMPKLARLILFEPGIDATSFLAITAFMSTQYCAIGLPAAASGLSSAASLFKFLFISDSRCSASLLLTAPSGRHARGSLLREKYSIFVLPKLSFAI